MVGVLPPFVTCCRRSNDLGLHGVGICDAKPFCLNRMKTHCRALMLFCLGVCCALTPVFAQEEDTVVFSSETTLVEFTIIALDRDGNPVSDLRPEEISIRENGSSRDLAFLRFEGGAAIEPTATELPAGSFSNRPKAAATPVRNVTAILLDAMNTSVLDQGFARSQVLEFLKTVPPETRIAVYFLGQDFTVVHDFTDDPASLQESVARVETQLAIQMGEFTPDEVDAATATFRGAISDAVVGFVEPGLLANGALNERRTLKTLAALEVLGHHLSAIPGRKNLVWITGGIPMLSITGNMGNGPKGGIKSYESWVRTTGRQLATQGIALYAVDARGLAGNDFGAAQRFLPGAGQNGRISQANQASKLSRDSRPTMEKLAGITGGRAFFDTNDMSVGIKAAAADVLGTYTLGFYAVDEPDGTWRDVDVRVSRKGVGIERRKGYVAYAPTDTARPWTEREWLAAIYSPLPSTALSVDARGELTPFDELKQIAVDVQFDLDSLYYRTAEDGSRQAFVELALASKDPDGTYRLKMDSLELPYNSAALNQSYDYHYSWALMPQATTVRVIVRDQLTGRYGTVDLRINQLPLRPAAE